VAGASLSHILNSTETSVLRVLLGGTEFSLVNLPKTKIFNVKLFYMHVISFAIFGGNPQQMFREKKSRKRTAPRTDKKPNDKR
jgi:hypothetical protein